MGQPVTEPEDYDLEPVQWTDLVELLRENEKPVTDTIPTPLETWNSSCRDEGGGLGLAPGWFVVIAGKPGSGKSVLAVNCIVTALANGKRVGLLSYEMSRSQMLTRAMAIAAGCPVRRLERGPGFSREAFVGAAKAMAKSGMLGKLFLDDAPDRSVQGMRQSMACLADMNECSLIVVDYAQLIGRKEHAQIFERTQMVSAALKEVAKDLRVTVMGLSQFNRTTLANRKEAPGTEGLKGGTLDEDADQIVMLDYSRTEKTLAGADSYLVFGKNRHGPEPEIPIRLDYKTLQVRERTSMDDAMAKIRRDDQ